MTAAPSLTNTSNHYEYAYDHEGNTTDRYLKNGLGSTLQRTHYTWDYRNRLARVEDFTVSGTVSTPTAIFRYTYNASDQRVAKALDTNGDGTPEAYESFIYDGSNLVLTTNDMDAPL